MVRYMKEKQEEMIRLLLELDDAIPSKSIASQLNISQRTVKNYVKEINCLVQEPVLLSSQQGYVANKNLLIKLLDDDDEDKKIPQTYMERAYYMIKQLIMKHQPIQWSDLCAEMFIEYSTLKNDISKMNKTFEAFNVYFLCKNNLLLIKGSEKSKRKLMSHIIYEETNNNFFNLEVLYATYGKEYIEQLSMIVRQVFKQNNYYINDFAFMNLILHLTILIDRVLYGKVIHNHVKLNIERTVEEKIIMELCLAIEEEFEVVLETAEVAEIYLLFKTDVNISLNNNSQEIKSSVGDNIYKKATKLVELISKNYMIDLMTESFLTPFSLHLKGLISRLRNNTFNKNPMIDNIKQNCPIIYEIAIFISLQLSKELDTKIEEDEVAYIALHVGSEIERQKKNNGKVKCVVYSPDYMNLREHIEQFLLFNYSNDLTIISSINYPHQMIDLSFDLLITTLEVEPSTEYTIFNISPFNFEKSKTKLYHVIEQIQMISNQNILKLNFDNYFSKEMFYHDPPFSDKNELLHEVCQNMVKLGVVNPSFEQHVLEREYMSSTVFGNIAIPHSVHMEAIKTCIVVIVSKEGIVWNGQRVHIVLLTAINTLDRRNFRIIYEALLELFEQHNGSQVVADVNTFQKFKQFVERH